MFVTGPYLEASGNSGKGEDTFTYVAPDILGSMLSINDNAKIASTILPAMTSHRPFPHCRLPRATGGALRGCGFHRTAKSIALMGKVLSARYRRGRFRKQALSHGGRWLLA